MVMYIIGRRELRSLGSNCIEPSHIAGGYSVSRTVFGNTPKAKIVTELYGRLTLLLVRANAQSKTPQQENELIT